MADQATSIVDLFKKLGGLRHTQKGREMLYPEDYAYRKTQPVMPKDQPARPRSSNQRRRPRIYCSIKDHMRKKGCRGHRE